jgi:hypothetical protein
MRGDYTGTMTGFQGGMRERCSFEIVLEMRVLFAGVD